MFAGPGDVPRPELVVDAMCSARGQQQVGGTYKVVVMLERGPLPADGGVSGTWHKPCWPEAFDSGGSS